MSGGRPLDCRPTTVGGMELGLRGMLLKKWAHFQQFHSWTRAEWPGTMNRAAVRFPKAQEVENRHGGFSSG